MKDNEQEVKTDKNYIQANVEASKVIQVNNLKKDFLVGTQIVNVLKDITFEINKGEFAVIIGASGSGKSTLLHTLLGLEPPTAGIVKVLDTEIYLNTVEDDRSVFRKRHIGMVYQQPNWIRSLSVLENVSFPLILLGIDKTEATKRAWEAIFDVGMREWTNYKPTELSGGQQQKVALARALVINPEIIVADEPTGNLDYESGKNLMEMLVALNNQGRTIIMVTHDLEYLKYCNTAVRIKDGLVQGVYRGNDITQVIKDTGLTLKKKNTMEGESKSTSNKAESKKEENDPNRIKAKEVIERSNKRIEEINQSENQEVEKTPTVITNELVTPKEEIQSNDLDVEKQTKEATTIAETPTSNVEPKDTVTVDKETKKEITEEPTNKSEKKREEEKTIVKEIKPKRKKFRKSKKK